MRDDGHGVLDLFVGCDVTCYFSPKQFDEFGFNHFSQERKLIGNHYKKRIVLRKIHIFEMLRERLFDKAIDRREAIASLLRTVEISKIRRSVVRVGFGDLGIDVGCICLTSAFACLVGGYEDSYLARGVGLLDQYWSVLAS